MNLGTKKPSLTPARLLVALVLLSPSHLHRRPYPRHRILLPNLMSDMYHNSRQTLVLGTDQVLPTCWVSQALPQQLLVVLWQPTVMGKITNPPVRFLHRSPTMIHRIRSAIPSILLEIMLSLLAQRRRRQWSLKFLSGTAMSPQKYLVFEPSPLKLVLHPLAWLSPLVLLLLRVLLATMTRSTRNGVPHLLRLDLPRMDLQEALPCRILRLLLLSALQVVLQAPTMCIVFS